MSENRQAAYGSWSSPISSAAIVADSVRLSEPAISGDHYYWVEGRPAEQGRCVLVRSDACGNTIDVTPAPFSVRSKVHEYGGGAYTLHQDTVYFVNHKDQQIYLQQIGRNPSKLTRSEHCRFADLVFDSCHHRLLAVSEDHFPAHAEAVNILVAIDPQTGTVTTLCEGADFYSTPAISPDGRMLAWLSWNHPSLPWDSSELWLATLDAGGQPQHTKRIAGGPGISIFQPAFAPDGTLYFASDQEGWWNLFCYSSGSIVVLTCKQAEAGRPQWVFGQATYGFTGNDEILCAFNSQNCWQLTRIDRDSGQIQPIDTGFDYIEDIAVANGFALLLAGSAKQALAAVQVDANNGHCKTLRRSSLVEIPSDCLSRPEHIRFPTGNREHAYGFYYPPVNNSYQGMPDELPPLLVKCHGGPTAATAGCLDPRVQYWTSRGFAVLDVNYRGSCGYGRQYRDKLHGNWGIYDVEDCISGALHLANEGKADRWRLAISGTSAGGYTVLCALTFHDIFSAGASYYGIGDLQTAMTGTHKFESRYGDTLIGPWPAAKALYHERSPLHGADRLHCPVIFFQGLDDKVVPPDQAECMVDCLQNKGIPHAYLPFDGEGHGFRQSDNIRRALDAEFLFYATIFGFKPAEKLPQIQIHNLSAIKPLG